MKKGFKENRIFAILISLLITLSMSVTAFAEGITGDSEVPELMPGTEQMTEQAEQDPTNEPEAPKPQLDLSKYRKLTNRSAPARNMNINLRTMLGEGNGGYAVAQGSATDGRYAYHMMASSSTQKGRVLKTTLDGKLVKKGGIIGVHHANGMTYDSKRNKLVCVGYGSWRQQLSFIDPDTLAITTQRNVSYPYNFDGLSANAKNNGIAAIAYVEKYDVYVARSRGKTVSNTDSASNNDIWVFDAESLEAIGHVRVKNTGRYPNTYQSMAADERYVYYLLSPGSGQSRNIILCLDWNSEKILPVVKGQADFVEDMWYAGDSGDGKEDAVINIPINKESEGLYFTQSTDEDGNINNHFYVTEYRGAWVYKTVTKTKKYKVKWKKVKKKVKWKKVNGKWKYKKKKVWKYKTKKKKVKVKVKDYYSRNDYVYDLGVI